MNHASSFGFRVGAREDRVAYRMGQTEYQFNSNELEKLFADKKGPLQ